MPAQDTFSTYASGLDSPVVNAVAVTPDDANDLSHVTRALYVGEGGDLRVTLQGGATVTFTAMISGTIVPLRVSRVLLNGTTASNLVALW